MTSSYVLSLQAQQDLTEIAERVASESGIDVAAQVVESQRAAFRLLAGYPGVGHPREDLTSDPGVRFWSVLSYLIAFAPRARSLGIVCVVHGSRDPAELQIHLRRSRRNGP